MSMLDEFIKIISSETAIGFIKRSTDTLYDKEYPFCSYVAIHYCDDELVSVKFYVTAFKKIDFSLTKKFFPYSPDVEKAYERYKEGKIFSAQNMGFTFAQKISQGGKIIYAYYQRLNEEINPPIDQGGLHDESKVIDDYLAYEGASGKMYQKYYYLVREGANVKRLLQRSGLGINANDVDLVEYATFDGKQKVLAAVKTVAATENYLRKTERGGFLELHDFVIGRLGFVPASPGKYLNSPVRSIYYFSPGEPVYLRDSFALLSLLSFIQSGEVVA
jgi:hypothetical protein